MRRLFAAARRAAQSTATVLLLGETGTGKDVLARAIHDAGPRAAAPFVVFDCGAVAPTLIESQLFGHVRGAFTGADADRPGVFEWASGGTLLLDEIGELGRELQPKLLRVLETQTVTRVGATTPIPVDVRIVAATNRDLGAEVEADQFRADLYYRLAVIVLEVPPLRDRREDVPLLAAAFGREFLGEADLARLRPHLDEAFGSLRHHRWPGNVRELRNVIERAAAMVEPEADGRRPARPPGRAAHVPDPDLARAAAARRRPRRVRPRVPARSSWPRTRARSRTPPPPPRSTPRASSGCCGDTSW